MSGESAATPNRDEPARLPADRAFVVQLRPAAPGTQPWIGRVEHIVSGRSARFDGCDELRRFVEGVLADDLRSRPAGEEPA